MPGEDNSSSDSSRGNGYSISTVLRTFSEPSESDRPFVPKVGGQRFFILLLYASVLVVASIEFFASQRIWYGSWEIYNSYVLAVTAVFVFLGMVMLISAKRDATEVYSLPIPRVVLGSIGFVMFSLSGLALLYWNKSLGGWAVALSITLIYGFLMTLIGGRGFDTKDTLRLTVYATGLVIMILVPVHEAFGVAKSPSGEYPFTLLNLVLLTSGMSLALISVQSFQTRDGFVGAWLMGAMAIFLIAFHEQIGIVASGNYSPYDRALALIGVTFSFLPLVMYAWRERVYFFLWKKLKNANTLIETGDYKEALKQANDAIRQCSRVGVEDRFALPWSLKADALYRMKAYEKARVHYDTALTIDPKDSTSWCHMGNMYAFEGKQEAALKAFDQALKVEPTNGYAWNNKGAVYQSLGMFEDALICFDKAAGYMPDSFDAHINMAKLFSKLGHSNDALFHYHEALDIRPNSDAARDGIKREFFRSMCMDQINGWEQLGMDTSYLRKILDEDPAHFVSRSKEFLKNIVEQRTQLTVLPSSEHIDINAAIQSILRTAEGQGVTLDKIEEATNLKRHDLVLPLALLMETDHVHFKTVGKQQLYVSKGRAPEKPPEPVAKESASSGGQEKKPAHGKPVKAPIKCPGCGHVLTGDETKCPNCDLPLDTASFDCPICHEEVTFSASVCPKCGAVFRGEVDEAAAGSASGPPSGKEPKDEKASGVWPRRKKTKAASAKKEAAQRAKKKEHKRREVVTFEPTASVLVFKRRK
jgi:tetratricopeptide (TPR) repeat protein